MTRYATLLAVTLGLVLGLAAWPTPSDARKCAGLGFSCNAPEGCELQNQMMLKWAYRAVFDDPDMAAAARKAAEVAERKSGTRYPDPGMTAKEWDSLINRKAGVILEEAARDGAKSLKLPACPGSRVTDPPGMSTDMTTCKVTAQLGNESFPPEQAFGRAPKACDEIIEASRMHEAHHVSKCTKRTLNLDEVQAREKEAYTIEIRYLRDQMAAVGHWCTPSKGKQALFSQQAKAATKSVLQHQIGPVKK